MEDLMSRSEGPDRAGTEPRRGRYPLTAVLLLLGFVAAAGTSAQTQAAEEQERMSRAAIQPPPATPGAAEVSLSGRIYDRDQMVGGAEVTLKDPIGGRWVASSESDGGFELNVAAGRYEVEVTADGYRTSSGSLVLGGSPLRTELDIELRRLDEATPRGVESVPQTTLRRWLELGNDLLAQGEGAAAEVEFRKALQLLQGAKRHEVQRAIARARWLQKDVDGTLDELEVAMAMELQDGAAAEQVGAGVSYQLLEALLQSLERSDEAPQRLASAEQRAAELARQATQAAQRRAPAPLAEPAAVQPHRVGRQHVRFDPAQEPVALRQLEQRLGEAHFPEGMPTPTLDLGQESVALFVPENYRARDTGDAGDAGDARPWGVLVWVSPVPRGDLRPDPELERVLAEQRIIWAGAQNVGNQRPSWQRVALALATAELVRQSYDVATDRVFVAGYSGGGRVSSAIAWRWPELFAGGIFWMGCDYHRSIAVPFHPGGAWSPRFPEPNRAQRKQLERRRLIYVTGDRDFNRSESRVLAEAAYADGFEGARYLRIPDADHYFGVQAEWLERALRAADGEEVEGLRVPERWPAAK